MENEIVHIKRNEIIQEDDEKFVKYNCEKCGNNYFFANGECTGCENKLEFVIIETEKENEEEEDEVVLYPYSYF